MPDPIIPAFVSSAHYGLEDLRAMLARDLRGFGVKPYVSSEAGFPDSPGVPPYVACLEVLERCMVVIAILDARYGQSFDEWGPYGGAYKGLSPTHAELRHALARGIPMWAYVRESVQHDYLLYNSDVSGYERLAGKHKTDTRVLQMFAELKRHKPAPWIESFRDATDISNSVLRRLLEHMRSAFEKAAQAQRGASQSVEMLARASAIAQVIAGELERHGLVVVRKDVLNQGAAVQLATAQGAVMDVYHTGTVVAQDTPGIGAVLQALDRAGWRDSIRRPARIR